MDVLDEKLWLKLILHCVKFKDIWGLEIEYFHKKVAFVEKPTSR